MNFKAQQAAEWRKSKVLEMLSKGETNQSEIARILHVDRSCICKDVAFLREQAKERIKSYVDEVLPEQFELCLVGLNEILKNTWSIADLQNTNSDYREKLSALALAKEVYSFKIELLTNATVVDNAMKFIAGEKEKEKVSWIPPKAADNIAAA